jgi:hypothetical protein
VHTRPTLIDPPRKAFSSPMLSRPAR